MAEHSKPGGDAADGNVAQIRDILFGGHMRDYERRFLALEQRTESGLAALREQHEERFATLERSIEDGFERLAELLRREGGERAAAFDELESRFLERARAARTEIDAGLADLARRLGESDARQRSAVDDAQARFGAGEAALARTGADLAASKVGRLDLATLLAEFAQRLRGDSGTAAAG